MRRQGAIITLNTQLEQDLPLRDRYRTFNGLKLRFLSCRRSHHNLLSAPHRLYILETSIHHNVCWPVPAGCVACCVANKVARTQVIEPRSALCSFLDRTAKHCTVRILHTVLLRGIGSIHLLRQDLSTLIHPNLTPHQTSTHRPVQHLHCMSAAVLRANRQCRDQQKLVGVGTQDLPAWPRLRPLVVIGDWVHSSSPTNSAIT